CGSETSSLSWPPAHRKRRSSRTTRTSRPRTSGRASSTPPCRPPTPSCVPPEVRFLVDAQLPPALARMLTERGHHAEHVVDIASGDTPDTVLWQYALDHDAVIITKDEDFADLVTRSDIAPRIVWVRLGN